MEKGKAINGKRAAAHAAGGSAAGLAVAGGKGKGKSGPPQVSSSGIAPAVFVQQQGHGRGIFVGGVETLLLTMLRQQEIVALACSCTDAREAVQGARLSFTGTNVRWLLTVRARGGEVGKAVTAYRHVFPHAKAIHLASSDWPAAAASHLLPFTEIALQQLTERWSFGPPPNAPKTKVGAAPAPAPPAAPTTPLTDEFLKALAQGRNGYREVELERASDEDEEEDEDEDGEEDEEGSSKGGSEGEEEEGEDDDDDDDDEEESEEEDDPALAKPVTVLHLEWGVSSVRGWGFACHGRLQEAYVPSSHALENDMLRFPPSLRKLTLFATGCNTMVLEDLEHLEELTRRDYKGITNGGADAGMYDLGDACPNLRKLTLTAHDKGCQEDYCPIITFSKLTKLEDLELNCYDFWTGGIDGWLDEAPLSLKRLRVVEPNRNYCDGPLALAYGDKSIARLVNLEWLEVVNHPDVKGEGLTPAHTKLQYVHFADCPALTTIGKRGGPPPALTDLELSDCGKLKDEGLAPVAAQLRRLKLRGTTKLTQVGVDGCAGLEEKDTGGDLPRPGDDEDEDEDGHEGMGGGAAAASGAGAGPGAGSAGVSRPQAQASAERASTGGGCILQ